MNPYLKKFILWILLLLVFAGVYGVWKIHRSEKKLENWVKKELVPTDSTMGISISGLRISAVDGTVTMSDLKWYKNSGELTLHADQLVIHLGRTASAKLSILPAAYVLNSMESLRIQLHGLRDYMSSVVGTEMTIDVSGNPLQLIPLLAGGDMPSQRISITCSVLDLNSGFIASLYPAAGLFVPIDESSQFMAQITFDPLIQHILIEPVLYQHDAFEANVQAVIEVFPDQKWSDSPIEGQIIISNLNPEMQNLANNIEFLFGISLKRQDESIKFDISGTPKRPVVL